MPKGAITKRTVDSAKAEDRDQFIWDTSLAGFGLKVTPSGRKTYIYQYRIAPPGQAATTTAKRYTIGQHGALTPEQARKRCKELAAMVEQAIDPRQRELDDAQNRERAKVAEAEREKVKRDLEFGRIADIWLDHYENEKERRPASVRQATLVVDKHLRPALAGKPMPDISRDDLEPIIEAIPAQQKATRRSVHVYASILWNWALRRRYAPCNPLLEMEKPQAPRARDRVLEDSELLAIWDASNSLKGPFASFIRLLILTGQRRSEVAGMTWEELDKESATWTIGAERAKNSVANVVPLSAPVFAEIEAIANEARKRADNTVGEWPTNGPVLTTNGRTSISGISKAKTSLDGAVAKAMDQSLAPWRLHDLRRTLATGLQRLGVRFEVTEAVLAHVSGAKGGVAGVYQRHEWSEEKRAALEAWARHVGKLGNGNQASNVIAIETVAKAG